MKIEYYEESDVLTFDVWNRLKEQLLPKGQSEWLEEEYRIYRGPDEFRVMVMGEWPKHIGVDMGSEDGDKTVVSHGFPSEAKSVLIDMKSIIDNLTLLKSGKRTELDRYLAVTITEMEKVMAYFETFVVRGKPIW